MAQSVDIEIRVDQSGAVSGLRAFGTEMASTTSQVKQLSVALGDVNSKTARITNKGLAGAVSPGTAGLKQFAVGGGSSLFDGFKKDASAASESINQLNFSLGGVSSTLGLISEEAPALEQVGGHALTSLDNVRLLRDDLGIRLPRSMEKAIASSKALSSIVNGLGAGLLAVGAIQIGFSIASAAYDAIKRLWDEQLSLTKSAEDYEAEVQKTRDQAFGNSDSIEDTRLRIDAATDAVKRFQQQSAQADNPTMGWRNLLGPAGEVWQAYKQRSEARKLIDKSVNEQQKLDTLTVETDPKQYHEERLRSIDLEHARDEELRGQKRIEAEEKREVERSSEERRYAIEQQRVKSVESYDPDGNLIPANPIDTHTGESAERDADEIAKRRAQAQTFNLQRQQSEELTHMRESALESGLRGSALYHAQEAAAIADLKFKDMDSAAARNAIHLKFHNEEMKRLEDQQRATQNILDETKLAGLTGIAHVQQEGANRVDEVNRDKDLDDNPKARAERIAAIEGQTAQEVAAKQLEWTQRVDEVIEESQTRQVSGFARIRAEAEKARADLQRQFDEAHANMDLAAPGAQEAYDQDAAKLGQGTAAIEQSSDHQQAQLAEKNAQETLQIEQEAQRKSMSALKQQTAAIDAEYRARVSKYQEQLRQQEISQDDFDRRVAAAAEDRDAEMVEASRAAREKMAGEFDSLFKSLDHPMKALQSLGEKVAGEAAAELVQKLQQRAGVSTADSPAKGGAGILGLVTGLMDGSAFSGSRPRPSPLPMAAGSTAPLQPAASAPTSLWPWHHDHGRAQAPAALVPGSSVMMQLPLSGSASAPATGSISSAALPAHAEVYHQNAALPQESNVAASRSLEIVSATIRIASATISMSGAVSSATSGAASSLSSTASPLALSASGTLGSSQARVAHPLGGSTTLLGGDIHAPFASSSGVSSFPASAITSTGPLEPSQSTPRFRVFGETRSVDAQSWDDDIPSARSAVPASPAGSSPQAYSPSPVSGGVRSVVSTAQSAETGRAASGILGDVSQGVELASYAKSGFQKRSAAKPSPGSAVQRSGGVDVETRAPGASVASLAAPLSARPMDSTSGTNAGGGYASRSRSAVQPVSGSASASTFDAGGGRSPRPTFSGAGSARTAAPQSAAPGAQAGSSPASLGGAGASSVGPQGSLAGTTSDYPQKNSLLGTVIGDAKETWAAGKSISKTFSVGSGAAGGSGSDAPSSAGASISSAGSDSIETEQDPMTATIPYQMPDDGSSAPTATFSPDSNGGMLGGGGVMANAGGAISGGLGMYSAVEGDGGLGGALQGAMSGAKLGMALGGPIGAGIGLAAGAIVGAIGFGGREKARVYDLKTVRPKITGDTDSFEQGSMDYTSAYSDLQATDWEARLATGKMGPAAHDYYNDTIAKELKQAEAKLTQEQKAGRSMYTTSAAQFALGTDSVPHDGIAVIHKHERILRSDQNERITRAIENQGSPESIRSNYLSAMQARDARASASTGDRTLNMNVTALDARGVAQFFQQHKHTMRSALNDSMAENSGGGIA